MKPISVSEPAFVSSNTTKPEGSFSKILNNSKVLKGVGDISNSEINTQTCTYQIHKTGGESGQVSIDGDFSPFARDRRKTSEEIIVFLHGPGILDLKVNSKRQYGGNPNIKTTVYSYPVSNHPDMTKVNFVEVQTSDFGNGKNKIYGTCSQFNANGSPAKRIKAVEAPKHTTCFMWMCDTLYNNTF
jgi:hypothetical protein